MNSETELLYAYEIVRHGARAPFKEFQIKDGEIDGKMPVKAG